MVLDFPARATHAHTSTQNMSITEQLSHNTVRIECNSTDGNSVGTGFIFQYKLEDGKVKQVIVTNKHVVKGASRGKFLFTAKGINGLPDYSKRFRCSLNNFEQHFIMHPDDDIDLCILPIELILNAAAKNKINLFTVAIEEKYIPSQSQLEGLRAMEDIVMIGYPNGIWDQKNNLPVIRKGVTALHSKIDYVGTKKIITDIANYPGSSGSPIMIINMGGYTTKFGGRNIHNRFYLLGINYAVFTQTTEGEIKIINIPTKKVPIALTEIPINLGIAVKSSKLLDFKSLL